MRLLSALWLAIPGVLVPSVSHAQLVLQGNVEIKDASRLFAAKNIQILSGTRIRLKSPLDSAASELSIEAIDKLEIGTDVEIDASGEPAPPTPPSPALERTDVWESSGNSPIIALGFVRVLTDASMAEWRLRADESDRGRPGAPGRQGGPGGRVSIAAGSITGLENLKINTSGGRGGPGGAGGQGRPLREKITGQVRFGPPGENGPDGPPGPAGELRVTLGGRHLDAAEIAAITKEKPVNVTLTLGGGVSLGAYEAGYNWAFLRILRERRGKTDPQGPAMLRLAAITGASAGAINTLLSAMSWCLSDDSSNREVSEILAKEASPEQNLFWQTWVPIGFKRLFPGYLSCEEYKKEINDPDLDCDGRASAFNDDDGLFTRQAFRAAEQALKVRLADPRLYAPECRVAIGMPVTRVDSSSLNIQGLEVRADRHSIVLEAKTGPGGLELYDLSPDSEDARIGRYLHPRADGTRRVRPDEAIQLVEASSAFPLAFGPVQLQLPSSSPADPPVSAAFIDGGLYDNVPIGLALSILRKQPFPDLPRADGTIELHSIDSDRRRNSVVLEAPRRTEPARGLSVVPGLVTSFVSVSRKYELQALARYALGYDSGSKVVFSSRYYPVFGEYLAAFGAFLSPDFRRHDFYVGLYDALYDTASTTCSSRAAGPGPTSTDAQVLCVMREVYGLHERLHLSDDASYVVRRLLRSETAWQVSETAPVFVADLRQNLSASAWFAESVTHSPILGALLDENDAMQRAALRAYKKGKSKDIRAFLDEDHLAVILKNLEKKGHTIPLEIETDGTPDQDGRWLMPTATALAARLRSIDRDDEYSTGVALGAAGGVGLATYQNLMPSGFAPDPSSVPSGIGTVSRGVAHFLPYSYGIAPGLYMIGYRPRLFSLGPLYFEVPLNAEFPRTSEGYYGVDGALGLSLRLGLFSLTSIDVSAGVSATRDTIDRKRQLRTTATFLGGKLRFGLEWYRDHGSSRLRNSQVLAIEDLNGLLYWLWTSTWFGRD